MGNYTAEKMSNATKVVTGKATNMDSAIAGKAGQRGAHGTADGETPCSCPGCFPMFD